MKIKHVIAATAVLFASHFPILEAATFTWINATTGGSWQNAANWSSNPTLPSFASDDVLDFSTLNITANNTTTLDGAVSAGTLRFGDATTASNDWIVNAGTPSDSAITLIGTATPVIQIANRTATIAAELKGTQGFTKTGVGTLNLSAANTYTGTTTLSDGNLTLGISNALPSSAYLLVSTPAGVATTRTVALAATNQTISRLNATLNPNNGVTHSASFTGTGSLTVNGAFDLNLTNSSSATAGASTMTANLDLSGLSNFTYDRSTNKVIIFGNGNTRSANLILGGTNTLTTLGVELQNGGAGGNTAKTSTFQLGQANTINADSVLVLNNNIRDSATMRFRVLSNPSLKIRATDKSGRASWSVGTNIGNASVTGTALVDLVTGVTGTSSLDALISTLTVGQKTGTGTLNATFTMGGGTLDATSIILGTINAVGTLNSTFTLSGGTVKTTTLTYGTRSNGTLTPVFNLNNGGTLAAQTISHTGTATRTFNWNNGTIQNYDSSTDLTIASGIDIKLAATNTHAFDIAENRKATVSSSLSDASTGGTLAKNGLGTLELAAVNTYTGNTVVNVGTLSLLTGGQMKFVLGSASGSNNSITGAGGAALDGTFVIDRTAALPLSSGSWTIEDVAGLTTAYGENFSVAGFTDIGNDQWRVTDGPKRWTFTETTGTLVLETVASNLSWNGDISGIWDVNGSANWLNGATGSAYQAGDHARFDDTASGTTNVVLNDTVQPASVVFDNSTKNYTLDGTGSLQGFSSLTKSGSGLVTITTDNTYSGGTTINAGTLEVGNGGASGTLGSGIIDNNGLLRLNRTGTLTLTAVTGTGSIEQLGAGTTILSGNSPYTGATTITAGTLQIGAGGTAGSISATSEIVNNGTIAFSRSDALTQNLVISGTGNLVHKGPGTLILDGDMTYSGTTTIDSGTLQIGNNGTIGSVLSSSISNQGNLSIRRSDPLDFSQNISGSGSVTHAGSNTLRLTGTNSYTGATIISGTGTLLVDTSGANVPSGTALSFTGSGAFDLTDVSMTIGSLAKSAGANANIFANAGQKLTVTGGANVVVNDGSLSMVLVDEFIYDRAVGSVSANVINSGGSVLLTMANAVNSIKAASINIGVSGPNGSGTSSNSTVVLGKTNSLHSDTITVGSNGSQSGTSTLRTSSGIADATVSIRGASGGDSRATMTVGLKNTSDYAGGSGVVNFTSTGASLDARISVLTLGRHQDGAGNFNLATSGSFAFGAGTLDATQILMAVAQTQNIKTADGTLTTNGGTIKVGTLTMVQDSGGALGTATVNLNDGGSLEATTITGQVATNAIINWNQGTIANLPDTGLVISGATLILPATSVSRSMTISGTQPATLAANCVIASRLNTGAATPLVGGFVLTGSLDLANASLSLTDVASTPVRLATGTKLILINHSAGTLQGGFAGIADDSEIIIGPNKFVLDYNDTMGNTGSYVTLTANNSTPFEDWLATFPEITDPNDRTWSADPDKDGLANMVEYVLLTSPASGSQSALPVGVKSGQNLVLTYTRRKSAEAEGFVSRVEYSQTMAAGSWQVATAGMTQVTDNGTTETVVVTIPVPEGVTSLFARLQVSKL